MIIERMVFTPQELRESLSNHANPFRCPIFKRLEALGYLVHSVGDKVYWRSPYNPTSITIAQGARGDIPNNYMHSFHWAVCDLDGAGSQDVILDVEIPRGVYEEANYAADTTI